MVEVVVTNEFRNWYEALNESVQDKIISVVTLLERHGPELGYPHSSAIRGKIRELRVQCKGRPIRIFYAFDPVRKAVLILGGFKDGSEAKRFYQETLERAETIWNRYLKQNF